VRKDWKKSAASARPVAAPERSSHYEPSHACAGPGRLFDRALAAGFAHERLAAMMIKVLR